MLEARKLAGAGINPAVKVVCGKEIKGTGSRKGTANPFFDEVVILVVKQECMNILKLMCV